MAPGRVEHERGWVLGVLAVAAAVRLIGLGADVPLDHVSSAAPIEDAFWYLEAAAGAVEGGAPQPSAWDVPVWTELARVWLRLWGVSWTAAHALGACASWLAVLLTWRWVRSGWGARAALVAAATLAVLPPFVILGRTPLLYGPLALWLLTLAALTATRLPGALPAAYLGVIGAVVVARPPAGALLGGLIALEWSRSTRKRVTVYRWLGLGLGALAILFERKPGFVAETQYRLRLQVGSVEPLELVWRLLRLFGDVALERTKAVEVGGVPWVTSGSGYGALAAGALLAAACGALLALRSWTSASRPQRELLIVSLGWVGTFTLGVALMDARPLRYFPLIGPPLAALAGLGVVVARRDLAAPPPWTARVVASLVAGCLLSHLGDAGLTLMRGGTPPTRRAGFPVLAVLAAVGAAVPWLWDRWRLRPPVRRQLPRVLAALAVAPGAILCVRDLATATAQARHANAAAGELLGTEALVVGPHASYLLLGSGRRRLRAEWIRTQPPGVEPTLDRLIALGVTHIALGEGQADSARIESGFGSHGGSLIRVAEFETPFGRSLLYRFAWSETLGYRPTAAERVR